MHGFLNDLRFGLRQLAAKPGFAAAAILTLALGIGANTAVFSVLSGFLFKPLPYPHDGRLVIVGSVFPKIGETIGDMSVPNYFSIAHDTHAFSHAALFSDSTFVLQTSIGAMLATGAYVTPSLFATLGVKPAIGQTFAAAASEPGHGREVVLSNAIWQRLFHGDPGAVGQSLRIKGQLYRIIGVMPPSFAFPYSDSQVWLPKTIMAADRAPAQAFSADSFMLARLRPGVSVADANRQLRDEVLAIEQSFPTARQKELKQQGFALSMTSYRQWLIGDHAEPWFLLQGAVLLVLLMTCVNVANLLLSRILGRTHELAMRVALGAGRLRLARQLLIEGLTLAAPGGALGIGLGWWCLGLVNASSLGASGAAFAIGADWRVAGYGVALAAVTGVLVTLLPILQLSRMDLQSLLQSGGRSATGDRRSQFIKRALVVAEVTLATALVAASGLLLRSFVNTQAVNPGFNPRSVLTAGLVVPRGDPAGNGLASFDRQVVDGLRALPGVTQAGITNVLPFSGSVHVHGVDVRGKTWPAGNESPEAYTESVSGGYFRALSITPLRGRVFDSGDTSASRKVVVINTLLAHELFGHANPLGRQIRTGDHDEDWYTVVGVVPTIHNYSLTQPPPRGTAYFNVYQTPGHELNLVIKTSIPAAVVVPSVRKLVHRLDSGVPMFAVQPLQQRLANYLQQRKTTLALILAFGGIALALVIVGVYGVMSYAVGQRKTECGVRLALGALPEDLLWLVIKDGLELLAIGLVSGLILAMIAGFVLAAQLFHVAPYDPAVLTGTAIVLAVITLIACWMPARRAAKLDPAVAMTDQ